MISGPLIGQHVVETRVIVVQAEQQLEQLGPEVDPVTFRAYEDRE